MRLTAPLPTLLALLAAAAAPAAAQSGLEIHTIEVGKGEAARIVSPTGTRVLVDTGKPGEGSGAIVPYLQSIGVDDLDYVLISHYDGDHIGGMPEILAAGYSPMAVYDRGDFDAEMHMLWQDYVAAIGSLRQEIQEGQVLDLGGGAVLRNVIVNGQIAGGPDVSVAGNVENAKSAGWVLEYGNFEYGTFGDIGSLLEASLGPILGDIEVYKASHHGSSTSSKAFFIADLQPDVCIVSSGTDSSNPKQAAIDVMNTAGAMRWVYMTNDSSQQTRGGRPAYDHFLIETDGDTYTVSGPTVPRQRFLCDELTGVAAQPGDLSLSEFLPDPDAVPDAEGEYFELENLTTKTLSMKGWKLRDLSGETVTIASNALLEPRQILLFAAQGDTARNGGLVPGTVWPRGAFELDNAPDEILVDRADGTPLVQLSHPGTFFKGRSWERIDLDDPTPAANFDLGQSFFGPGGTGDRGTPGARNDADGTVWEPLLVAASPESGPPQGGTWVTLSGFDLGHDAGPPTVRFGRLPSPAVVVVDEHTLRARSPALLRYPSLIAHLIAIGSVHHVSGGPEGGLVVPITVNTSGGRTTLAGAFTYGALLQPPVSAPK